VLATVDMGREARYLLSGVSDELSHRLLLFEIHACLPIVFHRLFLRRCVDDDVLQDRQLALAFAVVVPLLGCINACTW